jgi:hypothetical protein
MLPFALATWLIAGAAEAQAMIFTGRDRVAADRAPGSHPAMATARSMRNNINRTLAGCTG